MEAYRERAQKIFDSAAERLEKYPFILTKMITALQRHGRPPKQVSNLPNIVVSDFSNFLIFSFLLFVRRCKR